MTTNPNCLWSVCEEVQYPDTECSFMGEIVLNAELKSTNSILMLLFSRCAKTEWRTVEMASYVDLLVLYANWGVQAVWDVVFDVLENQFFKALHQNESECHRAVVV